MSRLLTKNSSAFAETPLKNDRLLAPITDEVDDRYAMLNLNSVAGFIWDRIGENTLETDLQQALEESYNIDSAQAATDLQQLLDELITAGAVISRPAESQLTTESQLTANHIEH